MRSSYYEVINYPKELSLRCFPCNVMVNRPHWHSSLEIVVCLMGNLSMRVGDKEYHLLPGDMVTADSGVSHEICNGKPGGQQFIFSIGDDLIRREDGTIMDFRTVGENAADKDSDDAKAVRSKVYLIAKSLYDNASTSSVNSNYLLSPISIKRYYEILGAAMNILEILQGYTKEAEDGAVNRPSPLLMQCIGLIQSEYTNIQSSQDLADRLGISVSTLYRMLKSELGLSFLTYLNSVRISAAEALLLEDKVRIVDIPELCGFSSTSNFYRVFKEFTGCSPKQYREKTARQNSHVMSSSVMMFNSFESVQMDQVDINCI